MDVYNAICLKQWYVFNWIQRLQVHRIGEEPYGTFWNVSSLQPSVRCEDLQTRNIFVGRPKMQSLPVFQAMEEPASDGSVPVGNNQPSAAIYFTGRSYFHSKVHSTFYCLLSNQIEQYLSSPTFGVFRSYSSWFLVWHSDNPPADGLLASDAGLLKHLPSPSFSTLHYKNCQVAAWNEQPCVLMSNILKLRARDNRQTDLFGEPHARQT